MASNRNFYALECQANRDGYKSEDVTGNTLEEDSLWKQLGTPETLKTEFNCESVLERWKRQLTVSLLKICALL
jgi:hypothetical protein